MNQKHNVTAEKLGIQISCGTLAGLASGAVTISLGETNVFVSATAAAVTSVKTFTPTVDYKKFTAAGKFPGGYFKKVDQVKKKSLLPTIRSTTSSYFRKDSTVQVIATSY